MAAKRQREYAREFFRNFSKHHFMFWSPVVPKGYLTENLAMINGPELVINGSYKERIDQLRRRARTEARDTGNPFLRALQILEHLRE